MRDLLVLFIAVLFINLSFSQTETGKSETNNSEYRESDKLLNVVYKQILASRKSDVNFIKNLKDAQRQWIKYRDAQFKMTFPDYNGKFNMDQLTTDQAGYLVQLTKERIKVLKEILDPTSQGLLAYYTFNGNAMDSSGNGNDGINHGTASAADRFGRSNCAYEFNNTSYVSIPELFPATAAEFTFAAWIKKNSNIDRYDRTIIYKGTKEGEASMNIWPAGELKFSVNLYIPGKPVSYQNWYHASVMDTLKTGMYYFIAGRYRKGEKIDLFVSGILVSTTQIPGLNLVADPANTSSFIGVHGIYINEPKTHWNGAIDDVRIYGRALSDQEILVLYHEKGWNEK